MRSYNKLILAFLSQKDFDKYLKNIHEYPAQKTINALFMSTSKLIRLIGYFLNHCRENNST